MKLARFGPLGQQRPAIVDGGGKLRDASGLIADIDVAEIERLSSVDPETLTLVEGDVRTGVPLTGISKFLVIDLNYTDHAVESDMDLPEEAFVFMKALSCLGGPNDDVPLPRGSTHSDWEIEPGNVIGKHARYITKDEALGHVAGYVLINDLSERFDQHRRGGSWDMGNFPCKVCLQN